MGSVQLTSRRLRGYHFPMKKIPFLSNCGLNRGMGSKPFIILVLVLLFLIPLQLVKSLVRDREDYRDDAVRSVLVPLGGEPVLEGFCVAVPYELPEEIKREDGTVARQTMRRWMAVFPKSHEMAADVSPYTLTRGIFEVMAFTCTAVSSGAFPSALAASEKEEATFLWKEALFCVGVSNKRNFTSIPKITADGVPLSFVAAPLSLPMFDSALFFTLPEQLAKDGFSFSVTQEIQGGKKLSVRPVAAENSFSVSSPWKWSSFQDAWLPTSRSVSDEGFSAEWNIPGFTTSVPEAVYRIDSSAESSRIYYYEETKQSFPSDAVSVLFFVPVDNYQKIMRSIKYAILFLAIPFIALLVLEIFTKVRVHPVQYALIGLADVIFYLLLLAVSEHLPFFATYCLSCAAVCLLTLFYSAAIFRRTKWGALFSSVQLVLYIFLFGTLQAEDYALLIGTLGLFATVALLMFLTRKVDWYAEETAEDSE